MEIVYNIQIIIIRRQKVWHFSLLFFTQARNYFMMMSVHSLVRLRRRIHVYFIQKWFVVVTFQIWNHIDIKFIIIITNCCTRCRLGNFVQSIYSLLVQKKKTIQVPLSQATEKTS